MKMDKFFLTMFIIVVIGLSIVFAKECKAQDATNIKSVLVDKATGDTLLVGEGSLIEGVPLNLYGETLLIQKRVVSQDTTITILVPMEKDTVFTYEVTDTILIKNNQTIEKEVVGSSKVLTFYEAPGEDINAPLDLINYPINYKARLMSEVLDNDLVELRSKNDTTIISLKRLFVFTEQCIMPTYELPGDWQDFTVNTPEFWTWFDINDEMFSQ